MSHDRNLLYVLRAVQGSSLIVFFVLAVYFARQGDILMVIWNTGFFIYFLRTAFKEW